MHLCGVPKLPCKVCCQTRGRSCAGHYCLLCGAYSVMACCAMFCAEQACIQLHREVASTATMFHVLGGQSGCSLCQAVLKVVQLFP